MRIGLEAEYWVVDESGALCDGRGLTAVHDRVTPEFVPSMIELQTPPVESVAALETELRDLLERVVAAAEADGKRLVALGTPLAPQTHDIDSDRGAVLERIYGEGIEPAKNCAGTHIHFERGHVTRQLNLLTALDPALALVSSAPYYRGERLANCARAAAYRRGPGPTFARYRDLWSYTDGIDEWERRLEDRYAELGGVATERGVTAETFARWFQPENAVMTPVRLRTRSPTVEWRAPDTALPSDVLALAGDVVPLLRRTANTPVEVGSPGVDPDRIGVPDFSGLQTIVEGAIGDGLGSGAVVEYLERMGFDPERYRPATERIDAGDRIGTEEAKAIRLEHARKLHEDVAAL